MKLVIDIPEDEYNYIKNCYPDGEDGERYAYMIKKNATPLEEVLGEIKAELVEIEEETINRADIDAINRCIAIIDKHISGKEQG